MTHAAAALALGRILRLASRPARPGDAAEYERCRAIVLDDLRDVDARPDHAPNWARDRHKGAQGD